MNLYHCFVELKDDAKALAFAQALEKWMERLAEEGALNGWRLMRRKLNLGSDDHADFMLEIEVDDLSQLDKAFRFAGRHDDEIERLHGQVHAMIASARFALYRPYPDPERAERMALL